MAYTLTIRVLYLYPRHRDRTTPAYLAHNTHTHTHTQHMYAIQRIPSVHIRSRDSVIGIVTIG